MKTEIILQPRQSGKTTKVIKKAAETGAYIVCLDRQRARLIAKYADELGLIIRYPVTFGEIINYLTARGVDHRTSRPTGFVKNIIFDDAELFLQSLFPNNEIDMITMSDEFDAEFVKGVEEQNVPKN